MVHLACIQKVAEYFHTSFNVAEPVEGDHHVVASRNVLLAKHRPDSTKQLQNGPTQLSSQSGSASCRKRAGQRVLQPDLVVHQSLTPDPRPLRMIRPIVWLHRIEPTMSAACSDRRSCSRRGKSTVRTGSPPNNCVRPRT